MVIVPPAVSTCILRFFVVSAAVLLSWPLAASAQSEPPARFTFQGSFFRYGFFGQGATEDVFGPVQDTYGISYQFDDGSATDRHIQSMIGLVGADGTLSIDFFNDAFLRARRLDGNDYGGGFSTSVNVYVKAPPNTPYFIQRSLNGSVTAVHGGGLGTTHASMAEVTASVNNGSGSSQSLPVTIEQPRTFAGLTTAASHPSDPTYHFATSFSITAYGFTFQSIDICFFGCPALLDFRSTSELAGTVSAGPCTPQEPDFEKWNAGPFQTGIAERSNNCYNYATNRRTDTFAQPGGPLTFPPYSCNSIANAAAADGFVPITLGNPNGCGAGQSVVALVIAPLEDNLFLFQDYHWYRRNADGTWSHKPGGTPATNLDSSDNVITDPQIADRRYEFRDGQFLPGYTVFCGYYCVPCGFDLNTPPPFKGSLEQFSSSGLRAELLVLSGLHNPTWNIEDANVLSLISAKIAAAPATAPLQRRSRFGYAGFALNPSGGFVDFPDHLDVYSGIIRSENNGVVEYRADTEGLEDLLVQLATGSGFGGLINPESVCPGDLNNDGFVDDADFPIFVVAYNVLDCADPTMPAGCPADLNGDGFVDDSDFVIFVAAYNELICP